MEKFDLLKFLAAIAVFVYSMLIIEQSLKKLAGRPFKKFLQDHSRNPLNIIVSSAVVTGLLQSSSIVLMMVLSFVGSGLMSMRGALAAVLGSNLGSTVSNWLIALLGFRIDLNHLAYPLLVLALIGLLFSRRKSRLYYIAQFLTGFSFIFISLEWFKGSVDQSLGASLGDPGRLHYLLFIPIGLLFTALVQSSSVTVAITLAALYNRVLPFESAAAIVIGSELGTTLKFLAGSLKSIPDKKRVALGHTLINAVTVVVAAVLLQPLVYLIRKVLAIDDHLIALVAFQTGINLLSLALFYPLLSRLGAFLEKVVGQRSATHVTKYIGKGGDGHPAGALDESEKEIIRLLHKTLALNKATLGIEQKTYKGVFDRLRQLAGGPASFDETYTRLKILQGEILEYIAGIPKGELSESQIDQLSRQISLVRHVLRSVKNLKDIKHNMEEFSSAANDDLYALFTQMQAKAREHYVLIEELLELPGSYSEEKVAGLLESNRRQYDQVIATLIDAVKQNRISELELADLLNVNREIYSSNKALIRALSELGDKMPANGKAPAQ